MCIKIRAGFQGRGASSAGNRKRRKETGDEGTNRKETRARLGTKRKKTRDERFEFSCQVLRFKSRESVACVRG